MSEKEEIRRKLAEVDELRARVKELENNPVNSWWSPKNRRENRRLMINVFAWMGVTYVIAAALGLPGTLGVLFPFLWAITAIAGSYLTDWLSRRRR